MMLIHIATILWIAFLAAYIGLGIYEALFRRPEKKFDEGWRKGWKEGYQEGRRSISEREMRNAAAWAASFRNGSGVTWIKPNEEYQPYMHILHMAAESPEPGFYKDRKQLESTNEVDNPPCC